VILVDTSVWIDHFRRPNDRLAEALRERQILGHPFVIGELACGILPGHRSEALIHLQRLPTAPLAQHAEVMEMVDRQRLAGSGIGWVDAHLLASAMLASATLWASNRALGRVARRLGVTPSW